jgi:hypothetical protein
MGKPWGRLRVEMNCPYHGLERFSIKVIKKYNVNKELIEPKFRTKPYPDLSGLVIGKSVSIDEARKYLLSYYEGLGINNVSIS